jgi:hypothetical protein
MPSATWPSSRRDQPRGTGDGLCDALCARELLARMPVWSDRLDEHGFVRENRHHLWISTVGGASGSSGVRSLAVQTIMKRPGRECADR